MAVLGNLELCAKIVRGDPKACRLIDGAIQGAERRRDADQAHAGLSPVARS
jgi:hypothetical protein